MLLQRIDISNLLSFGDKELQLELKPLNVLIGPNGSGKSNLIEAMSLFQAAPTELVKPIREGGGISEWIWKGAKDGDAISKVMAHIKTQKYPITHQVSFSETNQRFTVLSELIAGGRFEAKHVYNFDSIDRQIYIKGGLNSIKHIVNDPSNSKSVLSFLKDPDQYPEITFLGEQYSKIKIYRDWSFDRKTPPREPMRTDEFADFLDEDCSNLALVLNRLEMDYNRKDVILEKLNDLYPEITDFSFSVLGGTVQLFLQEGDYKIPATRLSDGTLRYLCLLAILCHPEPPPLICIEEPEIGLHPDMIPSLRDLLKEASERTQLIITTHSDTLIDALSEYPEDVVICEKEEGQTIMKRLDEKELQVWLKEYSLGELWRSGQIGGNRW
ncbi:FIG00590706: hypothetical protein [hydrothermal vent metagenome]|uniref:ATPase AAA-type core domain-containing protein n=1 Tax=hydrothermal vent metagenome TaxID=652676 RepID=A0A3B1DSA3_9ZZZZ